MTDGQSVGQLQANDYPSRACDGDVPGVQNRPVPLNGLHASHLGIQNRGFAYPAYMRLHCIHDDYSRSDPMPSVRRSLRRKERFGDAEYCRSNGYG